jgi:hypothetical protein
VTLEIAQTTDGAYHVSQTLVIEPFSRLHRPTRRVSPNRSNRHTLEGTLMKPRTRLFQMPASCGIALLFLAPSLAAAQSWNGWARCQVDIRGTGYRNEETHTWFVNGATTTAGQATGSWTVAGSGELRSGDPKTQLWHAQWSINSSAASHSGTRFGVVTGNGVTAIRVFHAQLKLPGAIRGSNGQTVYGVVRQPTQISATANEWGFPRVQGAATSQVLTGSSTRNPGFPWGWNELGNPIRTESCTWSFAYGSIPAPPPPVQAPPDPPLSGTGQKPVDPCAAIRNAPTLPPKGDNLSKRIPQPAKEGERIVICPPSG